MVEQALVEAVTTQRNAHLACPKRLSNTFLSNTFHMWKEGTGSTNLSCPTWSIVHTMVHTVLHPLPQGRAPPMSVPFNCKKIVWNWKRDLGWSKMWMWCLNYKPCGSTRQQDIQTSSNGFWTSLGQYPSNGFWTSLGQYPSNGFWTSLGQYPLFSRATFDSRDPLVRSDLHTWKHIKVVWTICTTVMLNV